MGIGGGAVGRVFLAETLPDSRRRVNDLEPQAFQAGQIRKLFTRR